MFYSFTKNILIFLALFVLVILSVYMDKLIVLPKQTLKEIFSFPWNLVILTFFIHLTYMFIVKIKQKFIKKY